jgi:hypothetical protein
MCNSTDNIRKAWGVKKCSYCGKENVDARHICRERLQHINYVCSWCGAVSDDFDKLCNPEEIGNLTRSEWKKISNSQEGSLRQCKGCSQPVHGKGHICDPKLPYKCEFCGEEVTKTHHVCKQIIDNATHVCNVCGRLSVNKEGVCAPREIK